MDKLIRTDFVPFLDTTRGATAGTYTWEPIDLSEQFELDVNPNTETRSFICYKNDTTEITSNAPSMDQEIYCYRGNPMYDFLIGVFREFPVGDNAIIPMMIVYPLDTSTDTTYPAQVWDDALIVFDNLSSTDEKISFTMQLNGDVTNGTVATNSGSPTFTPTASASASASASVAASMKRTKAAK